MFNSYSHKTYIRLVYIAAGVLGMLYFTGVFSSSIASSTEEQKEKLHTVTCEAKWRDTIIAKSSKCIMVEGNAYFPPKDVKKDLLFTTSKHTKCPWKGKASYYTINIGGHKKENAAWFYPKPYEAAVFLTNYVAFSRRGMQIKHGS
mmetsp:Transcript_21382/g.23888  ORF Transcript_21382/g.23888 Transcript_21382/m.23888 type:complete len:146 (-) Transcript_21382:26-463(-)